ncbi:NAD(P)-dependent oxidoreductase [uncultured Clostridium sp.]|uniref:NAD(P)-dependent oxidoreductase n=1 Tax=uncultured Clostridium sp. TaxID=59620 RepID=UPI00262E0126|nr:NAD(P)-dependent oxidoreductase [uncultured Clostridium sp.]
MKELVLEAERCLKCKNPRCSENCPINTKIPKVIEHYIKGEREAAGEILFNNNPLSVVCSIVCPHEKQCMGNCIRGIKGEPIRFPEIEYEISLEYLKNMKVEKIKKNGKKVGIVGAGPAGIVVGIILAKKGYSVTIFESRNKIGGVLRYGIPEFRLDRKILDMYEEYLIELGVKIRLNTLIGPVLSINKLFEDGYKAIFIGTGVWNARTLGIKGESLGNVHYAIDYLKHPKYFRLGDKVNVIGAGNVAMDSARSAKYFGAKDVTVYFRGEREQMEATKTEIYEAEKEGVKFEFCKTPIEITEEGVVFSEVKVRENLDGKYEFTNISGSEKMYEGTSTIIAIGQVPRNNIVRNTTGISTTDNGLIITNEYGHTSREGIFACGDVVNGPKIVVQAVVEAKKVAESIDRYCNNF